MNGLYGALGRWLQPSLLLVMLVFALPALAQSRPAAAATRPVVLVMGDSLSAGYGLAANQGWVALTAARLPSASPGWTLVNASISGETTAGGAARIDAELRRHRPRVVVVELGANDGLRGLDLKQMRANLERIVQRSQAAGARVLVVGMRMPPNLGARYTREFESVFADTARKYRTAFLPFLLAPIASDRNAFQDDNVHPVASVQPKLRDHVWVQLRPLLSAAKTAPPARATTGSGG